MKGHWSETGQLMSCVSGIDERYEYGADGSITVRPNMPTECDIAVMFSDGSGLVAPFKTEMRTQRYISKPLPGWVNGTWYVILLTPGYPRTDAYWVEDEFTVNPLRLQDYGLEPSAVVPGQGQAHDE